MDFDQMLETWRAQNTAPPFDVNRDVLRQALDTEADKVRRALRIQRRALWFVWLLGTGMAVWAGFWIAITMTNGWPAIYAIAAGACLVVFALGAGALWVSRGRQVERNFGNTLQEEVRRNLALVDDQLSRTRRWILPILGVSCIVVGSGLFSWTLTRSQNIPGSLPGFNLFSLLMIALAIRELYRGRERRRTTTLKLETRQRRLRELLAALDAHD
jgi:hypothetical protein